MHRPPITLSAGALLAALSLAACTTSTSDTLTVRQLDLVDDEGRPRARIGIDEEGSAGVYLIDDQGRNRAALIHDDTQTALYLFDDEQTIRVGVAQFAHGGGGFALHGPQSKGATVVYMNNAKGSLAFYDEGGNLLHRLQPQPENEQGNPQ